MIEIPYERLSPEILRAVIEEFILREGTDYGLLEYSLDDKVSQVEKQLKHGKAVIMFDEESESCTLLVKNRSL